MNYKKIKSLCFVLAMVLVFTSNLFAVRKKFFRMPRVKARACTRSVSKVRAQRTTCAYVKKTPYQGFGKRSRVNNRIKTKSTSGHFKRTSKGVTFVNPYARSR